MIAAVAVEDVDGVDAVEVVLLHVRAEHVGHTRVETGAEQGHQSGLFEALAVGPLPLVFELRLVQRFVVGGIQVVHARGQAGIHNTEVLVGQRQVAEGRLEDVTADVVEEHVDTVRARGTDRARAHQEPRRARTCGTYRAAHAQ